MTSSQQSQEGFETESDEMTMSGASSRGSTPGLPVRGELGSVQDASVMVAFPGISTVVLEALSLRATAEYAVSYLEYSCSDGGADAVRSSQSVDDFVSSVLGKLDRPGLVFVSGHPAVCERMFDIGVKFTLAYPPRSRWTRYLTLMEDRGELGSVSPVIERWRKLTDVCFDRGYVACRYDDDMRFDLECYERVDFPPLDLRKLKVDGAGFHVFYDEADREDAAKLALERRTPRGERARRRNELREKVLGTDKVNKRVGLFR
jgi:hypothetical protein